mmetsp:Transcript_30840/g.49768  ORF Transcript_30840/g.49768 Transcript_30840/m.49768 type:complete len:205 (-) Transcript_30840:29-643(-)
MDKTVRQIATAIPLRCRHGHTRAVLQAQAKTTAICYGFASSSAGGQPELWKRGLIRSLQSGLPRAYLRPEQGDPCWSRAMTSHNHQTADTALLEAVKEDRIDDVKKILSLGDSDPSAPDKEGMTAVHHAALADHKQIVKILCEAGVDVNAQDRRGRTALHLCMPLGYSACVVHLYNAGVDDQLQDVDGKTAMAQTGEDYGPQNY